MKLQFGNLSINSIVLNRLNKLGFDEKSLASAICEHESNCDEGNPSVYCGTYAKYNDGSIAGLWIDLTTFSSFDEFISFCKAIHADEEDPELMFQDFEGFPADWYSEFFFEDTFDKIIDYHNLCKEYGFEAVDAFFDCRSDASAEDFRDAYCGYFGSEVDFAHHLIDECYDLENTMGNLACYFDYEAFARDLFINDYVECNGHVFRA